MINNLDKIINETSKRESYGYQKKKEGKREKNK